MMMGGLFWLDNAWALIVDGDPATMTPIGDLSPGGCLDYCEVS